MYKICRESVTQKKVNFIIIFFTIFFFLSTKKAENIVFLSPDTPTPC